MVAKLKKRASWQQYVAQRPSAVKSSLIEKLIIAKGRAVYIANNPKPMALTTKFEKCKQEMISWSLTENQFELGAVSSQRSLRNRN